MSDSFVNLQNSDRGGDKSYKSVIGQIEKDKVCPFCPENLSKYHKNPILKDGKYWLLTDNMYPYRGAKHQLLLIHKKHIENISQISEGAWTELLEFVQDETKKRDIKVGSLFMRFGETSYTGASVSHLHVNLFSPDVGGENREPIFARIG